MLPAFEYVRAESIRDAVKHLGCEGARLHAGGTDLLGCARERIFPVKKVVSISRIKGLHGIRETADGGMRIGALTTITEVAEHPLVNQRYSALAQGASEVASPQLRHQGTIGGNLCQKPRCWYYRGAFLCLKKGGDLCFAFGGENQFHCIFGGNPCYIVHPSDTAPALMALGAMLRIVGPRGTRSVALEQFYVLPSQDVERETVLETEEILTEVLLPPPEPGLRSSYRKVRARRSWDFALAGVALALVFDGDRVGSAGVVLSGAAPVPWRSKAVEEVITGVRPNREVIAEASEAAVRGATHLEKNEYKVPLFRGVMEEELRAACSM